MAVINILDKHTAELIAAGEVVEKPSSVIKELVENSIDAGAKKIIVDIERGGIKKMLVQDNGSGIDSEYIRTAFIRHATSKLSSAKDLESIQSLGFRGEALASIASVSNLEVITKTDIQDFAVELKLKAGEEQSFEVKPFVTGTRFIVRDLFFNTPARMKFLKKDSTEASYIQDVLTNLALSKPEISFEFKKDGKDVFNTFGDGDLLNTIANLYGNEFAKQLVDINYSDNKYSVDGYISLPHFSRQSRNMQFMFINGRLVKNKTIIAAIESAYKGTVMTGKFPAYVINFSMPFENIDVNVHPAKTEVRFDNDKQIFDVIYKAVKSALSQDLPLKNFAFKQVNLNTSYNEEVSQTTLTNNIDQNVLPVKNNEILSNNQNYSEIFIKPIEQPPTSNNRLKNIEKDIEDEMLHSNSFVKYESKLEIKPVAANGIIENKKENYDIEKQETSNKVLDINILGEIFSTYILFQAENELLIADKHAAHERLLYEKHKANAIQDKQLLLLPLTVKLSALEKDAIINDLELLDNQGFEIEDFGIDTILLRAIPMNISSEDPSSLIQEIAHNLSNGEKANLSEKLDWIFHSVSCRSAIKAGDKTNMVAIKKLISDIKLNKIPLYCPHGRPVIMTITKKELEKQFGR